MDRIKYIVNILIVALLLGAIAIGRDSRILGHNVDEIFGQEAQPIEAPIEISLEDGTCVISSASLSRDVIGYAGRTPMNIYVKDDIIVKVEALPNSETPSFFAQLTDNGFFDQWNGMSIEQATTAEVDVISGATFSSVAVIKNVQNAAAYGASVEAPSSNPFAGLLDLKTIVGILVILSGAAFTLLRPKNNILKIAQMGLNVVVLGFWCGSFLSLTQFVSWMSNGFHLSMTLLAILLLAVVVIMPMLGKKGSYCHIHCPMGSAQALLGQIPAPQLKFSARVNKFLNKLRYYILLALLFLMWIGVGFDLMNYEVFSIFMINSASTFVIILAVVFLGLSPFVAQPYCRFICPTGALLTLMQKTQE